MKTVFAALSGGVDSAVSAALLKERGHRVVGCFIKIWQPEFVECTWREDRLDALRVCAALGIPFREIDLSAEYKAEVVDEMVADYARGATPNPDVLCNSSIKFGHFFRWARAEGADFVATGHYARVSTGKDTYLGFVNPNMCLLRRGVDADKDQSYFLWRLGQEELARTLFPIGESRKHEVRARAHALGLPVAEKPDSQGICFLGDVSMADFLARFITLEKGAVLDRAGAVIGEHDGAPLYTIGQRHGFRRAASGGAAQYVVALDVRHNTITVSPNRLDAAKGEVLLADVHWTAQEPALPCEAEVQGRYREAPIAARISREGAGIRVSFAEPRIVSPGQSLVVYQGDELIGGGVIAANVR